MFQRPISESQLSDNQNPAPRLGELEFHKLLERLPAGAYTCDQTGLITYFNQRAAEFWGRAPKLNDPEDRFCGSFKLFSAQGTPIKHDQCWMALALQQNKEFNGHEIIVERPDGGRLTALAHANPIHDDAGALCGAVNVLVDISDRKRAEEALAVLYAQLEEADRRKDEFLATLAHELRNPLAPIRNSLHIMRLTGSEPNENIREMLERQVEHLVRLVDDLLEVSRITRGKIELRREQVELSTIIRAAIEASVPLIEAAGHQLAVSLPPEPIVLDADAVRVSQIFANLLNNAAKYTEQGGQIWLTARRDGKDVVVSVRDTGIGIPSELMPRIFELFTQFDHSRSQGGLGIGLTLVKRLVEMHGGQVEARSSGPDQGSEFVVRLPLLAAAQRTQADTKEPGSYRREATLPPQRILVVDDNKDGADTLGELLRVLGAEVQVAYRGDDALELITAFHPAVVLMDLGMPGMDGFELARRIRQTPDCQGVLLIALTGWGQAEHRNRSLAAGFDYHLVKPVKFDALRSLLVSSGSQPNPKA